MPGSQSAGRWRAGPCSAKRRWKAARPAGLWIPRCSDWNSAAIATFHARYRIFVNGRPLALRQISPDTFLSGLRYRRTNLYPSMHPGIPTQLPLQLTLVDNESGRTAAQFEMGANDMRFALWPKLSRETRGTPLSRRPQERFDVRLAAGLIPWEQSLCCRIRPSERLSRESALISCYKIG